MDTPAQIEANRQNLLRMIEPYEAPENVKQQWAKAGAEGLALLPRRGPTIFYRTIPPKRAKVRPTKREREYALRGA